MNKEELKQAAEVMKRAADGEMVECRHRSYADSAWAKAQQFSEGICWNWTSWEWRILDFPPPPEGQQWHNPAGLNATQVGVHQGWRLMTHKEFGIVPADMEAFDGVRWCQIPDITVWYSLNKVTFRTKAPLPSPKVDAFDEHWEEVRIRLIVQGREASIDAENWPLLKANARLVWNAAKEHFTKPST